MIISKYIDEYRHFKDTQAQSKYPGKKDGLDFLFYFYFYRSTLQY